MGCYDDDSSEVGPPERVDVLIDVTDSRDIDAGCRQEQQRLVLDLVHILKLVHENMFDNQCSAPGRARRRMT
jgi:hypothetical protein